MNEYLIKLSDVYTSEWGGHSKVLAIFPVRCCDYDAAVRIGDAIKRTMEPADGAAFVSVYVEGV